MSQSTGIFRRSPWRYRNDLSCFGNFQHVMNKSENGAVRNHLNMLNSFPNSDEVKKRLNEAAVVVMRRTVK